MHKLKLKSIQIVNEHNGLIADIDLGEEGKIILGKGAVVVKDNQDSLAIRLNNINLDTRITVNGLEAPVEVENKYKLNKKLWKQLGNCGTQQMYNMFIDSFIGDNGEVFTEWASNDNGKTMWKPEVLAHNAAITFLTGLDFNPKLQNVRKTKKS